MLRGKGNEAAGLTQLLFYSRGNVSQKRYISAAWRAGQERYENESLYHRQRRPVAVSVRDSGHAHGP